MISSKLCFETDIGVNHGVKVTGRGSVADTVRITVENTLSQLLQILIYIIRGVRVLSRNDNMTALLYHNYKMTTMVEQIILP